jgi:hypothetical protein
VQLLQLVDGIKILECHFYIPFSSFFVFLTTYSTFPLAEIKWQAIPLCPWSINCALSELSKIICYSMAATRPPRQDKCTDAPVNALTLTHYSAEPLKEQGWLKTSIPPATINNAIQLSLYY